MEYYKINFCSKKYPEVVSYFCMQSSLDLKEFNSMAVSVLSKNKDIIIKSIEILTFNQYFAGNVNYFQGFIALSSLISSFKKEKRSQILSKILNKK